MAVINLRSVDVDGIFNGLRESTGLFRIWKITGDDINTQCPFHSGGHEQNPSFGICNNRANPNYGMYHCFACGAKGTILGLINQLHNKSFDDDFAVTYAQEYSDLEQYDDRQRISLPPLKQLQRSQVQETVSQAELAYYREQSCDYLTRRHIDVKIQQAFDCGFDPISQSVTFPVKQIDGSALFFVRRAIRLKWYNYPSGITKPVYGIYELSQLAPQAKTVVLVESIINALTLWGLQIPALALLGTGSRTQIEYLNTLDIRNWVLAMDGDSAGETATHRLKQRLHARTSIMPIPPGKDVNDLDSYSISILYSLRRGISK